MTAALRVLPAVKRPLCSLRGIRDHRKNAADYNHGRDNRQGHATRDCGGGWRHDEKRNKDVDGDDGDEGHL